MLATNKIIKVTCETKHHLPINVLEPLQGQLKTLTKANAEKLRQSLIRYGITFPAFVWKSDKNYIIDAHQRIAVLGIMIDEGWEIEGPGMPVVFVEAKTKQEAGEKLLLASSSYAEVTQESLCDFVNEFNLDIESMIPVLDIPGVYLDITNHDFQPVSEDEQPRLDQKKPIICPECGHEFEA